MNPLNPLYIAVAWVMTQIHAGLSLIMPSTSGEAWFLTIVLLVVLMRLILVPLFVKQMHSMRKMSALTPQLQELRKKYKSDKQTLNEETMRLYRENGVNPLGGCLPLLAQMPVFFALFSVLRAIAGWQAGMPPPYGMSESVVRSAQNANILGAKIGDKVLFTGTMHVPLEAKIVICCAVAISVITTFMTVRQNTKRGLTPNMTPNNPMAASQKYMAYIVPFFALSGLYWQFGLVLYWVTTNVWTLGQQYVLFKRYPMTAVAGAPAVVQGKVVPPGKSSGSGKPGSGKAAPADRVPADGKPAQARKPARGAAKPAAAKPPADAGAGQGSANGSGVLRRLTRGRPEPQPEPQPAAPDTKLVRQQRTRQSRSKRSGKR